MPKHLSLFILCESLGWEQMQEHSFVEGLAGNRAPVHPIFGPKAASLPTILTGELPQVHGHFAWLYHAPQKSPFKTCKWLKYVPQRTRRSWRFQNMAMNCIKKAHCITGRLGPLNMPISQLPHFDFVERKDPLEPGAFGSTASLIDFYENEHMLYYRSRHDHTDRENTATLMHMLDTKRVQVAFLDLEDISYMVKKRELDSTAVRNQIAWTDRRIRSLYAWAAELYDRVDLFLFSDTGVIPVQKIYNLKESVMATNLSFGLDYIAVYEPAMVRFWFLNDNSREVISNLLESLPAGTVLSQVEEKRYGCYFEDRRFGDLTYVAHDGAAFVPNDMEAAPPVNLSGYRPENEHLRAGFACNVADVSPPETVDEIHGLLLEFSTKSAETNAQAAATAEAGKQ